MSKGNTILIVASAYTGGERTHINQLVSRIDADFFFCIPNGDKDRLESTRPFCTYSMLSIFSYIRLLVFVRDHEIRLIHCHGLRAATFVRLLKLLIPSLPPIIVTIHGFHYARYRSRFRKKVFLSLERWLHRVQHMTIAVSGSDYLQMVENHCVDPQKAAVIENGVNLDAPREKEKEADVCHELEAMGIDPECDCLIYGVGALEWVKGFDVLVRAVAVVRKKCTNVKLLLFGTGGQQEKLRELAVQLGIENEVMFMGNKRNVHEWLRWARVFVMSSRYEGLPYALLEAMSSGVPVVASDVEGCRDIVTNNYDGLFFTKDDYDDLARKTELVLLDDSLRKQLSLHALETVKTRFNVTDMAGQVQKVYRVLLDNE